MINKRDKTPSNFRQTLSQFIAVYIESLLLLGYGMTLGFPTILIPNLSDNNTEEKMFLGDEAISWIGSVNFICVPIGCLLSGPITRQIGCKRVMQMVTIPFLTAWLLFYFSDDVWQIFLALSMTGVGGGLLEAPVLTYVSEITQPHLRGMLSSTTSTAVFLGGFTQFLLGTFVSWRTITLINCSVPVLCFILLFFVPESPIWLISKNRLLDAQKSIAWLKGWSKLNEVESEYQELCKQLGKSPDISSVNANSENKETKKLTQLEFFKLFTKKNFLWPYAVVSLAFFLNHFAGMTPLQTYAIEIFTTLKSPIDEYYATVILGVLELVGCFACVTLVHYTGKRIINILSLLGSGVCFFVVATYAHVTGIYHMDNSPTEANLELQNKYSWIPIVFLNINTFFAHLGIRILPWVLTGEIYSTETRSVASGLSAGTGYVFGFLCNKIFLSMVSNLSLPGTFWIYSSVGFIGSILLYYFLPETEGKTLYDIMEHFSGNSKLGNHVLRKRNCKSQEGTIQEGETNDGFHEEN